MLHFLKIRVHSKENLGVKTATDFQKRKKTGKELKKSPHFPEPCYAFSAFLSFVEIKGQTAGEPVTTGQHVSRYTSAFQNVFKMFTMPLCLHVLKNTSGI